ncbi:hypothetical protein FS749_003002 [Ceratobasidium sp. UAMH 11750]|nr:hypothetical protein FS749_003002 [Ceratobasidium sp. UAMH 11750]
MQYHRGMDFTSPVNYPVVAVSSPVPHPSYPHGPLFLDQILSWVPSSLFSFMSDNANNVVPTPAGTPGTAKLAHEDQARKIRTVHSDSLACACETLSGSEYEVVALSEHNTTDTRRDTYGCGPYHEPDSVPALVPLRPSILQPQSHVLHTSNAPPGPQLLNLSPSISGLEGPYFESPTKYFLDSPVNGIDDEVLVGICDGVRSLARSLSTADYYHALTLEGPELNAADTNKLDNDVTCKILMIGSNYCNDPKRAFSITSLESPSNDKEMLKVTFKARGYSVWLMVNNTFDREDALTCVSEFLSTARRGDVRAIVFTGHAERPSGDERTVLIPPNCPKKELAIPADVWERTIRENAKPGVIVLSIFASCFSGDLMHQKINLRDLDSVSGASRVSNVDLEPILVTFSSSTKDQRSYESSVELEEPCPVSDHFLHVLNLTAQSPDVKDWQSFIRVLESHFEKAREVAAKIVDDLNPKRWIEDSPQTPMYSASSVPSMKSLFPDIKLAS